MVSAVKWEAASTARVAIDLGTTLANDTMSAVGAEIDNSTNLDTYFYAELTTSDQSALFDTTPPNDTAPTCDLYMTQAPDGTNYEDAPLTGGADQMNLFVGAFPIQKNTTSFLTVIGPFLLPPHKLKFYLDNQNGAGTLTAEWEVNIYTNNFESQ